MAASLTVRRALLLLLGAGSLFSTRPLATPLEAQTRESASSATRRRLAAPTRPPDEKGRRVLESANAFGGLKILVSTEDRWLWLVAGRDTVMSVPVAVGMGNTFEYEGKTYRFETPRSIRKVVKKEPSPRWNVPEWHYMERAKARGLELVRLTREMKYMLEDGSFLLTIGDNVGRLNTFGNFWPFTPGLEIIFDGRVFVPPVGTEQRLVPDALGPYKLDTGDGYLLHGTNVFTEDTIGLAVSHGCVRLRNVDLERLYPLVPVGTPVYVF